VSEYSYTILGSSAGFPQPHRGSSGYVIQAAGTTALIDCGGSVCQNLLRAGVELVSLDRIFITHTHPDHVVELPLLVQSMKLGGRKNPVDLYIPEEFVDPFERMIEAMYVFRSRLPYELRLVGYDDGFTFEGPFKLRAIANRHLQRYAPYVAELGLPSRLQSFSFDLEINSRRLFHSGDVASFDDVEPYLLHRDYIVVEAAHVDLERLLEHAKHSREGKIIVTHVQSEEQVKEIERAVVEAGVANLVVATDGFRIDM
jgi:ribonuclease BN (tRNA processing enzyme)